MGKMLIIAEKPSVAREIAAALGGFSKQGAFWEGRQSLISSGIGHLVEIYSPEAENRSRGMVDLPIIPKKFSLRPIDRTKSQLLLLRKLMDRADVDLFVNACDAGREGELIFRLIHEWVGIKKPVRRMWLQSMTAEAIRSAFQHMRPASEFDALGEAARCRSEADWLVGINGTRAISYLREHQVNCHDLMTAGRVQTPTLAIIVHREREIRDFVPQDYWEVHGSFQVQAGTYAGKWIAKHAVDGQDNPTGSRIMDKNLAHKILEKCRGAAVQSVEDSVRFTKSAAPSLFDLTSLQREANRKYKFSAKHTLDLTQALYEKHKALTYPRTDSSVLPEDYVERAKEVMTELCKLESWKKHAQRVLGEGWIRDNPRIFNDEKISDHFAIIPTGTCPPNLERDEALIYELVVRRFIATFHPEAQYRETTRLTVVEEEHFQSFDRVLVEPGWTQVYEHALQKEEGALCAYEAGESVKNAGMTIKSLKTTPPSRYTEATLLSTMECAGKFVEDEALREFLKDRGLGTPATRAAIIEGLLSSKGKGGKPRQPYLLREGKAQHLKPTEKGHTLIEFLEQQGIEMLASPQMTGVWEQKLRNIEKGTCSRSDFMGDVVQMTHRIIDVIKQQDVKTRQAPTLLQAACPVCGSPMIQGVRAYACQEACGFRIWREIAGRALTKEEATELLVRKKTDVLEGFTSKSKRLFSAALSMDNSGKISFVFAEKNNAQRDSAGDNRHTGQKLNAKCPACGGALFIRSEEHPRVVCENGDFTLWQTIAGKLLSVDEVLQLVKNGCLPELEGFYSAKSRRHFKAGLRLAKDGKVTLMF